MKYQLSVMVVTWAVASAAVPHVYEGNDDHTEPIMFVPELPCAKEGGLCGLASACPPDFRHPEEGLCPAQKDLGAECCFTVPDNIVRCKERGGECVETKLCGRAPRDAQGQCSQGQVCCIFVN
ncbi:U-scoloptoxin(19)-Tl1a-like [Homarus americanus]|uniref:U-scoloptoxin(19)-Tl1a-like n=1 Tax=Homarus americanus TaxID=6706 RepID=A0A8J5NCB2_HOMAM|nr:U-scoloptoxin(19)-Tl1a-like [Homarus americanus]KAG7176948.1 U-scoloptoxin(19)-Tl1a-like [Homarus americanus]